MSPSDCCLQVLAQFQRQDPLASLLGAQGAAFASRCWWCTAKMSLATNGGLSEPPYAMVIKVTASICGSHRHTKSSVARNLAPPAGTTSLPRRCQQLGPGRPPQFWAGHWGGHAPKIQKKYGKIRKTTEKSCKIQVRDGSTNHKFSISNAIHKLFH